jgi:ABC-2 type transport system permease protein
VVGRWFLLCGLFVPRHEMGWLLDWLSNAMPLSYAVDALTHVTRSETIDGTLLRNMVAIAACVVLALVLGSATLRRRTP